MLLRISTFIQRFPLHTVLLPVYFIFGIYVRFQGLLNTRELLWAFIKVTGAVLILFILLAFFCKNKIKAAILATITGIFYLFFGDIKNAFGNISPISFISSYRFLLPLMLILLVVVFIKVIRGRSTAMANLFLNLLFFIYIISDVISLLAKNRKGDVSNLVFDSKPVPLNSAPDIYYILMDSYPSSGYQREVLGVDHNSLDTILQSKGFWVQTDPRSNYNSTAFSMSSVFNMEYINWMEGSRAKPHHFNRATNTIYNSVVIEWLQQWRYALINLSVFDLPGHPALEKERFLSATTTGLIFYNTLWQRLKSDLLPALFPSYHRQLIAAHREEQKNVLERFRRYNKMLVDSLYRLKRTDQPRFVYAHLEMPHFPYFYDSSGRAYADEQVYSGTMITDKNRFRNYIGYTNHVIGQLLDQLLLQTGGKAIIILQSDHGINDIPGSKREDVFRNYSAFYFPGKDYYLLYKGMSNVNTFRVVFNKYFGQRLPLLKDSSVYIR
jgi:hypothetical protein